MFMIEAPVLFSYFNHSASQERLQMKECTKCGKEKSVGEMGKDPRRKDGLQAECKACIAVRCKAWRVENRQSHDEKYYEGVCFGIQCIRCKELKECEDFSRNRNTLNGFCDVCRQCHSMFRRASHKGNPKGCMLAAARARAKKKGLTFSITKDDILIPECCPVLGLPLRTGSGTSEDNSPSLDRKDNTKGYIKGNVEVISHRANSIKNSATINEVRAILNYMEKHIDE